MVKCEGRNGGTLVDLAWSRLLQSDAARGRNGAQGKPAPVYACAKWFMYRHHFTFKTPRKTEKQP